MALDFTDSAAKHGFTEGDAINAMLNHVDKMESFDEPRIAGRSRPDLYVGPSLSRVMLEVMVERNPPNRLTIFHCMRARRRILDLVEESRIK
jgi:hypothetical protein